MGAYVSEASRRVERTAALADGAGVLRFVSGKRETALARLGLTRVRDVLYHLPNRYLDFSRLTPIGLTEVGSDVTVVGVVDKVVTKQPRPRLSIVEVSVADDSGILQATFFRQPWMAERIHEGDTVALSGKVTFAYGFRQMKSPFWETLSSGEDASSLARILPVHPVGEGVSASWMRRIVSCALEDASDIVDPVPATYVAAHGLMSLPRALRQVHFPLTLAAAEEARRRLAYDELLTLQLTLVCRQRIELSGVTPTRHVTDGPHVQALLKALPYTLTDEQQAAAGEIFSDMAAPRVMNRLLLGDVGTGKTAVALLAVAAAADSGCQAAVMAPTSVLARQHAEKLSGLLDAAGITWALVTGSTKARERDEIARSVRAGETCCVFGTTALISDDIDFRRLTLVVIDEQHRFGVGQRLALRQKGAGADLLTMSATPIPRTLALSVYGDLSVSFIRHRPRKGAKITTKVIAPENVDVAYGAIRDAVVRGERAYVICPLVDEADDGGELDDVPERETAGARQLHAATREATSLARGPLKGCAVGLVTGRMGAEDKAEAMRAFQIGETDVLVATTVVEVGVDVPEATVMLILDADRFGLATLHQLRGRVGRGDADGHVFMVCAAKQGTPARRRLSALEKTADGFELAEADLKLRHEGEVLGYRQHGGVTLKVTDLATDTDLVEWAHDDARKIAEADPDLSGPETRLLALECAERFGAYFEEMDRV